MSGRIPTLNPGLQIKPFDVGIGPPKFIVDIRGARQFEVSEFTYNILNLIDGNRSSEQIAESLSLKAGTEFSGTVVDQIVDNYFIPSGIVIGQNSDTPVQKKRAFLRLTMPLFSQDSIRPVTSALRVLFVKPVFLALFLVSVVIAGYTHLLVRADLAVIGNIRGVQLLVVYGIVLLTAFFHELGHSTACGYFGAKHGDIGVSLYLFFPVLYSDVSDIWSLNRRQRIVVDAGGIYFQMLCVPVLCILYLVSGSAIVLCAIYATYLTIATALNPFLRFDGYWMISDFFGVSNLRKRSLEVIYTFLVKYFRRRGTIRQVKLNINQKDRISVIAYGGFSIAFFLLFFLQVAFFLRLHCRKAASGLSELLRNGITGPGSPDTSAVLHTFDALLPSLIFIFALSVSGIAGLRYIISRLAAYRCHPDK